MAPDYDWVSALDAALESNGSPPDRYFQLATLDAAGHPRVRTLVFRGFADDGESLLAITDCRSAKIADLANHTVSEVCWYFRESREQFRLSVSTQFETVAGLQKSLCERVWRALSDSARAQFYGAAPGVPIDEELASSKGTPQLISQSEGEKGVDDGLSDNFGVLVMSPKEVDHLVLADPQIRIRSTNVNGVWQAISLNP